MHPFYIQQLFHELKSQSEKLGQLEQVLQQLRKDVDGLMTKNQQVNYHFDLLKIEKLEGTLNIGMTPSDGKTLEDVTVNGQSVEQIQRNPKQAFMLTHIQETVFRFLEDEIPDMIEGIGNKHGIQLDPQYVRMIVQDIRNQLDNRIEIYLEQFHSDQKEPVNELAVQNTIIEQVKRDIETAVKQHIEWSFSGKQD